MLRPLYRILENPKVYDLSQKLLAGNRVYQAIKNVVALHLRDMRYNNVLDVGCGIVLFADCFNGEYTGIDINPEYIKRAKTVKKGTFLVGDATALPFNNEAYDLVFTLGVLHHLNADSREKMLKEMWRVCKSKGYILIIDGIVPSNRLNMIGYILAKLDRGRFKMRIESFKEMINSAYPDAGEVKYSHIKSFPYEFIAASVQR